MTHEELLAEIGDNSERTNNALCAVVKLHRPTAFDFCMACDRDYNGEFETDWPCSTIQAIEKELA